MQDFISHSWWLDKVSQFDYSLITGLFLTLGHGTNSERVSGVSLGTHTTDVMQGNLAESVRAAESCTRIGTLLSNASLIAGTFTVHETFWPTIGRSAYKFRHTGTGGFIIWWHCALGVWSTRRGFAWVLARFFVLRFCSLIKICPRLKIYARLS